MASYAQCRFSYFRRCRIRYPAAAPTELPKERAVEAPLLMGLSARARKRRSATAVAAAAAATQCQRWQATKTFHSRVESELTAALKTKTKDDFCNLGGERMEGRGEGD